jgi:hypothetical protein
VSLKVCVGDGVPVAVVVIDAGVEVIEAVAVFEAVIDPDAVPVTVGMQYVSVNAGDKPRITVLAPAVTIKVDVAVTVLYM